MLFLKFSNVLTLKLCRFCHRPICKTLHFESVGIHLCNILHCRKKEGIFWEFSIIRTIINHIVSTIWILPRTLNFKVHDDTKCPILFQMPTQDEPAI